MAADVRLCLRGLMVERFLRQALIEGVILSDVCRGAEREAQFRVSERDAATLLALAEKYKLDLRVVDESPWVVVKRRMKGRLFLPASLLGALLLAALFLSRLWLIELPDDADPRIAAALLEMGVKPGIALSSIDTRVIEQGVYARVGDYAFIGARLDGVRLKLSAVEELPDPELYDLDGARDLVASHDAVLLRINAFTGQAVVKPGAAVRRGDLLIRGQERVSDESVTGVCALGEVVGRIWLSGESEGRLTYAESVPTGVTSQESHLALFDYSVQLKAGHSFANERTEHERLPVGGLFLPLTIERTTHIETRQVKKTIDEQALKTQLAETAHQIALEKVPRGAEIVDKWIDYSMIEGDLIRARAVIEVHQNIAVSRSALKSGGQ